MPLSVVRARHCLQNFDFRTLFTQELGWERHASSLPVAVDGKTFTLQAVAEKRGFQVFECPSPDGELPDHATRSKVERQVAKSAHEHIIIYTDQARTVQKWLWVRRELGRPLARREFDFRRGQTGELLVQKLQQLAFSLEEEENLTLVEVTGRVRAALDVDRVTKRFYDRFKSEHAAFLEFIEGIRSTADREWYASLMLNRLMFVYFIQKKGFLAGDANYLRSRLRAIQQSRGKGKFLSFYRLFLLRLFHEGLAQPPAQRARDLEQLLGEIPYLNGGLFDVHELEEANPDIQIADEAFERLFDFFDAYQWHLDERPLRADNEINPDVLGYIFEKYINQKQMGAYYTKEDITGYIARNTIIPFLFDTTRKKCAVAFQPDSAVWRLLRDDPDRYIPEPIRLGVIDQSGAVLPETVLPDFVQRGLHDPKERMLDRRYNLAQAELRDAEGQKLTLPTETWREYASRRQRCLDLRGRLQAGDIHDINDLVTLNLDVLQFAEDVIDNCEGPELLRAFWQAINGVSVLDPTCGSGAFLFAALNVLEPLYEACLDRMQTFLDDLEHSGQPHRPEKFSDFRKVLDEVVRHPNRRYFILKAVVINNLYGVDIMEEAVEICKLRLFLKLVAQVDKVRQLEPLPDIDFNIRPGNTLVGFATLADVQKTLEGTLGFARTEAARIAEEADVVNRAFLMFRAMQTEHGMDAKKYAGAKEDLRRRLARLREELDRYLAGEYGVDPREQDSFCAWGDSHRPFHWFAEFYGIMTEGGFDVIIGNPPWVEYAKVRREYTVHEYETEPCGNLHGLCTERGLRIRSPQGRMGFIVQLPMVSSSRMATVRQVLRDSSSLLHVLPFGDRPGKLFEGLEHCRGVIWLSRGRGVGADGPCWVETSRFQRWPTEVRSVLLDLVEYAPGTGELVFPDQFPKYASPVENTLFGKVKSRGSQTVGERVRRQETDHFIFYQEATEYWVKAVAGLPYYAKNGRVGAPAHGRYLYFGTAEIAHSVCALLHSSLFYTCFVAYSDCFHLSDTLVRAFPIAPEFGQGAALSKLGRALMRALRAGAERKEIQTKGGDRISYDEYFGWKAKDIIDKIDRVLAKHYGFADQELDFILNYDIKFRMGQDAEGDAEE